MSERPLPPLLIAALASAGGAALVLLGVIGNVADVAVAILVAAGALLPVRVPWGGNVPMGAAGMIAAAALLSHWDATGALAVGVVVSAVVLLLSQPGAEAVTAIERFAGSALGAVGGAIGMNLLVDGTVPTLASAIAASAGLVVADLVVARYAPGSRRLELRSALPVHLTLACAGILIAVAVAEVGAAMAAVAAFPLLITRFSFERYAGATDTLEQTVQALGLVPELAGLAPLGHSERSANYAVAIARELGMDRAATTRVVTATRLHHLGAVPFEADIDDAHDIAPGEVAEQGARIIREAGLSADIADLLGAAKADVLDAIAPSLEAAVVRVAATFDEIVGDDAVAADRGLSLVSSAARDPHSRRAAAALLELVATEEGLVRDAIAAGDRFREAAVGLDLEAITASRGGAGELLPFARRS